MGRHTLLPASRIREGQVRCFTIAVRRLAVGRTASGFFALDDRCPHAGARARNLLRWFLRSNGLSPPPRDQLSDVLRQMLGARPDAQPRIDVDGVTLRRFRGWLLLEPATAAPNPDWTLDWSGAPSLDLPPGGRLYFVAAECAGLSRACLAAAPVTVRSRSGGERLRPAVGRPTRTLKNLLREAGVPAWQRAALPLIFVGDALAWAAAVGYDCGFSAQPGEPGMLVEWP